MNLCCLVLPGFTNKSSESEGLLVADSVSSSLPLMVENQPLTLNITPVVASQLVHMFGPSATGLLEPLNLVNIK